MAIVMLTVACEGTGAEDTIVIAGKDGQASLRSTGEVVDYTGAGLVFRHAGGREQTIPAGQVLEVQSPWVPAQVAADEKFQQGRYEEALHHYREALDKEPRQWVKRLILSQSVWCFRRTGQSLPASLAFVQICRQDPATPYFDSIPLPWETRPVPPALEEQSRKWLADSEPSAARLLACGWLLSTSQKPEALAALRQLSSDSQPAVAFLAEAQIWRTTLLAAGRAEAERWQTRIDRMPAPLQAGPLLLLAQLQSRLEQSEQAAITFMKIAILHSRHAELAARSLLGAGTELEKIGQRDEASRLYEELVAQYPDSADSVGQAKQRLEELAQPKDVSPPRPASPPRQAPTPQP
jgi:tetratricopeptide (TPR) repeat protein